MTEAEFDEQHPNVKIRWQTPRDSRQKRLFYQNEEGKWVKVPTVIVAEDFSED